MSKNRNKVKALARRRLNDLQREQNSVQVRPDAQTGGGDAMATLGGWAMFSVGSYSDECPAYYSTARDRWLRDFVTRPGNDLLAGTIATVATKVSTTGFIIEGPERAANLYRNIIVKQSDFGYGYNSLAMKWSQDILTQDSGGALERLRTSSTDTQGAALGFAHLDMGRCYRTGDPEYPLVYTDQSGEMHRMHRSQVMLVTDMPSPRETLYGVGFCAVSRALTIARILMDIARYKRERLSDLPPAGILMLSNLSKEQWADLETQYDVKQQNAGNTVWRNVMLGFSMDPSMPAKAELFEFSRLPEHFDEKTITEISIYSFALAFNIDPRELWPVSAGPLGTATEANIQHLKARGKGAGGILTAMERAWNDGQSLPASLTFKFDFQDSEEDEQAARIKNLKIDGVRKLWEPPVGQQSGLVPRETALNMLALDGIMTDEQVAEALSIVEQEQVERDEKAAQIAQQTKPADTSVPDVENENEPSGEESASDTEVAKTLSAVDLGPLCRCYSDGRTIRLEHRPQLWGGWGGKARAHSAPARKSGTGELAKSMTAYRKDIAGLVRGLWNGSLTKFDFVDNMFTAMRRGFVQAWQDGAKAMGVSPKDISDEQLLRVQEIVSEQSQYLPGFADYITEHNKASGEKLAALESRAETWVNRYAEVTNEAKLFYAGEQRLEWVVGPTEHCTDCAGLSGRVYTKKTWDAYNLRPQMRELECGGFKCQCKFRATDKSCTPGRPPALARAI